MDNHRIASFAQIPHFSGFDLTRSELPLVRRLPAFWRFLWECHIRRNRRVPRRDVARLHGM